MNLRSLVYIFFVSLVCQFVARPIIFLFQAKFFEIKLQWYLEPINERLFLFEWKRPSTVNYVPTRNHEISNSRHSNFITFFWRT